MVKDIIDKIAEDFEKLTEYFPQYWVAFTLICDAAGWNEPSFEKVESSKWMVGCSKYVSEHAETHQEARALYAATQHDKWSLEIQAIEASFAADLGDMASETEPYEVHWAFRDYAFNFKRSLYLRPNVFMRVWEADWMETFITSHHVLYCIVLYCIVLLLFVAILSAGEFFVATWSRRSKRDLESQCPNGLQCP